jgi:hypothetical protein
MFLRLLVLRQLFVVRSVLEYQQTNQTGVDADSLENERGNGTMRNLC